MKSASLHQVCAVLAGPLIGSVWLFHGIYSKLLHQIPRHEMIVGRVLGSGIAGPATLVVGAMEVVLGLWVFTGRRKRSCALVQSLAIAGMNTLEIWLAEDLLISAPGMLALNAAFLSFVWFWATRREFTTGAQA